jgi:glycosyltransferase involved in cell wall biosynthesis
MSSQTASSYDQQTAIQAPQKKLGRLLILNVPISSFNQHLFVAMQRYWDLKIIDVPFPWWYEPLAKALTFHPLIHQWKERYQVAIERFHKSAPCFARRTRYCERQLPGLMEEADAVLQISGMFAPSGSVLDKPYAIFHDYTVKLAEREWPPWAPFKNRLDADAWYTLERALYHGAAKIFSASEYSRRSIVKDYGVPEDKTTWVGYGLPLESIPKVEKAYDGATILFVGYDFKRKGGLVLLKAFEMVRRAIPTARLVIVGPSRKNWPLDGPGRAFLGYVSNREQVKELFRKASLFVMPSLAEPFGLVFLEAMAYRLPCIGTTSNAMPEIIEDGVTGYVVPPHDAEALAGRMIHVLRKPDTMRSMGEAGRQRVLERFTCDKVSERITTHLQSILTGAP